MNGLMGQLPEWMRSPAALSLGGLILLLVLVLVFRRRGGGSANGLPSGRGWRSKVPLPTQASPLEAMRAALESSRKIDPRRQAESPPEPPAGVPPSEAASVEAKRLPGGEASNVDGASDEEAPDPSSDAEAAPPEEDAASDADTAKVVPLPVGTSGTESRSKEAESSEAPDEAVSPAPARKQKG